jgi:hypothetical protein
VTPSTRPRVRLAAGLLCGALLLPPLAACSFSSDSVSCSGGSCSVTLTGDGAKVRVLGYQVAFAGTDGGLARLSVGDRAVSCSAGQNIDAGPLRLECAEVADDSVRLRASLG